MEYKEYGSKNNDTIVLLHGGGLSWWSHSYSYIRWTFGK